MKTHRIPQDIAGFQGRIIGKLTPKQFVYLGVGGMGAFLIFTVLPLSMVTIIIGGVLVMFTLMMALAQIQDRSLDEWLINFVLALQTTPQRIWLKESEIPQILLPNYKVQSIHPLGKKKKKTQKQMNEFISFWRSESESDLTDYEKKFMERIGKLQ